jgi:hypothetical protein
MNTRRMAAMVARDCRLLGRLSSWLRAETADRKTAVFAHVFVPNDSLRTNSLLHLRSSRVRRGKTGEAKHRL